MRAGATGLEPATSGVTGPHRPSHATSPNHPGTPFLAGKTRSRLPRPDHAPPRPFTHRLRNRCSIEPTVSGGGGTTTDRTPATASIGGTSARHDRLKYARSCAPWVGDDQHAAASTGTHAAGRRRPIPPLLPRRRLTMATTERPGIADFYEHEVLPALTERLDQAFPEFGWTRDPRGWHATNHDFTHQQLGVRADRVVCHGPAPRGFLIHGDGPVLWTTYAQPRPASPRPRLHRRRPPPRPARRHRPHPDPATAVARATARRGCCTTRS